MNFNPDPTKQTQEVIFCPKLQITNHPCLIFNQNTFNLTESQKHFGMFLDSRLEFKKQWKSSKKLAEQLGFSANFKIYCLENLIKVYKYFIKPQLDYGGIIYDQAYNASFHRKQESIQCTVALTITGAIQRTSKERLCQELVFESL